MPPVNVSKNKCNKVPLRRARKKPSVFFFIVSFFGLKPRLQAEEGFSRYFFISCLL